MRVLIAGAGGVAGLALAPRLSTHFDVVGLDRPEVEPTVGIEWAVADIRDWRAVREALQGMGPVDALVDLVTAPHAGLEESDQAFAELDVNVAGAWTLITEALAAGVRRVVYLSTLNVYGDLTVGVHYESDDLLRNHTRDVVEPYGLSKLLAEQLISYLCHAHGATGVALRLDALHVPEVMERRGVHVDDLAEAIRLATTVELDGFRICNITSRPAHHQAPIDAALTLLGWRPSIEFPHRPDLENWAMTTAPPLGAIPSPLPRLD